MITIKPPRGPAAVALGAFVALVLLLVLLPAAHSRWWLPIGIAAGIGLHALLARGLKAVLSAVSPLASGAPEAAGYDRSVYGTPGRDMLEVAGTAVAAGLLMGVGAVSGWGWVGAAGVLVLLAAVGLDVQRWQRVAASADWVWFQRGWGQKVHQVAIENIRDISIHEEDVGGFTLRRGSGNRICRLNLRMADKRIVALPKTDAHRDLEAVEDVANHIRTRQQLTQELQARREGGRPAAPPAAVDPTPEDEAMMRELRRLRRAAAAGATGGSAAPTLKPASRPASKP